MKRHTWIVVAMVASMVSGCGEMWRSKNKLEESPLSKFGQKKIMDDAREEDSPSSAYEAGEESLFSFGSKGGLFGGGEQKGADRVRADKLFSGAMEVVMALPIQVASREGGVIATNWKVDPTNPNLRFRVNIHVTGRKPFGDVRVVVLKQERLEGHWQDRSIDKETARNIKKSIRKRAQVARP